MSETQTPSDEDFMRSFVELQRKVADISNAAVGGAQLATGDIVGGFATTRAGCLLCDGSIIADADYGALGAYIRANLPAAYIVDGTHVKLPDYRGAALGGADGATFILGTEVGTETTSLTAAQSGVPAHTHPGGGAVTSGAGSAHSHTVPASFSALSASWATGAGSAGWLNTGTQATSSESAHTHSFTDPTTGSNSATGATTPHTNIQPTLPANWFIKT